jgi:hypothetical protein
MNYQACHNNDEFVELTDDEYDEAWAKGIEIYQISQARKLQDNRDFVRNGVDGSRVQCLGEVASRAVAKACRLPWISSLNTFQGPDLNYHIEVRLIGQENYGLRVYEHDYDAKRVVGIVIPPGKEREPYRIPGWINACYGKRPEWLKDWLGRGRPVFCVPQERLFPLAVLLDLMQPKDLL